MLIIVCPPGAVYFSCSKMAVHGCSAPQGQARNRAVAACGQGQRGHRRWVPDSWAPAGGLRPQHRGPRLSPVNWHPGRLPSENPHFL